MVDLIIGTNCTIGDMKSRQRLPELNVLLGLSNVSWQSVRSLAGTGANRVRKLQNV